MIDRIRHTTESFYCQHIELRFGIIATKNNAIFLADFFQHFHNFSVKLLLGFFSVMIGEFVVELFSEPVESAVWLRAESCSNFFVFKLFKSSLSERTKLQNYSTIKLGVHSNGQIMCFVTSKVTPFVTSKVTLFVTSKFTPFVTSKVTPFVTKKLCTVSNSSL